MPQGMKRKYDEIDFYYASRRHLLSVAMTMSLCAKPAVAVNFQDFNLFLN